jgi:hypothetical protein
VIKTLLPNPRVIIFTNEYDAAILEAYLAGHNKIVEFLNAARRINASFQEVSIKF